MDIEELRIRKPAKSTLEIPPEVHESISLSRVPTKNLVEWLAADRQRLLDVVCKELKIDLGDSRRELWDKDLSAQSALKQSFAIGRWLMDHAAVADDRWRQMLKHESDIVREWSALMIGCSVNLTFPRKLAWMKTLADDSHSGVREIAWLALRSDVCNTPEHCIDSLCPWTGSRNANLRRFASEVTRPRGVWSTHVELLKEQPSVGLPILEPLWQDDSPYVQDSVGNWLNDASKSQPEWVLAVTDRWLSQSESEHTRTIVRRALRTIRKQKGE